MVSTTELSLDTSHHMLVEWRDSPTCANVQIRGRTRAHLVQHVHIPACTCICTGEPRVSSAILSSATSVANNTSLYRKYHRGQSLEYLIWSASCPWWRGHDLGHVLQATPTGAAQLWACSCWFVVFYSSIRSEQGQYSSWRAVSLETTVPNSPPNNICLFFIVLRFMTNKCLIV